MIDIWKHGKYLDTWSIVHFLSGFLLANAFYWYGFDFLWSLVLSLLIMLGWEICEMFMDIIEPSPNVATDIIVGLLGYFLGASMYFYLELDFKPVVFLVVLISTGLLALWGLLDFLKRGYR
jgi:hypothetical protein